MQVDALLAQRNSWHNATAGRDIMITRYGCDKHAESGNLVSAKVTTRTDITQGCCWRAWPKVA